MEDFKPPPPPPPPLPIIGPQKGFHHTGEPLFEQRMSDPVRALACI